MSEPAVLKANRPTPAPGVLQKSLTDLVAQLKLPPETLRDHVEETYGGRSYMALTSAEIGEVMEYLNEQYEPEEAEEESTNAPTN